MKRVLAAALFATVSAAAQSPAHAGVKFADIGTTPSERQDNLRALERHFEALAKRYVPVEQDLIIEVTDVDLAGEQHLSFRHPDLRVVRRIDWPRMSLRYTLKAGEKIVAQGEERLSDMGFDSRIGANYSSSESLSYERRMMEDWFKTKFATKAK
jgi:hypothetical protein